MAELHREEASRAQRQAAAEFICIKCSYSFYGNTGPTCCPSCGHLYLRRRMK